MRDIARGKAKVALITYGSTTRTQGVRGGGGPLATPEANVEDQYGVTLISNYAMVANRHMHQYGTKPEAFAEISVVTRAHAMRNPEAVQAMNDLAFRDIREITHEDVINSRVIADPLRILECCMVSDGGGAVIVAAPEVARGCPQKPVWLLGSGEAMSYPRYGRDITISAADRSGPAAFGEAGVTPPEVDVAMIYDSFTITVMCLMEDLGFCPKGEFGAWAAGGRLRWDNPLKPALNTDGGGLSSNHPGMRGIFLLIEAARQLRGQSTSQVPGARLAVASGCGGQLGTRHVSGTVILAAD
jgi:acetyl-CoA C-acetyltransferase